MTNYTVISAGNRHLEVERGLDMGSRRSFYLIHLHINNLYIQQGFAFLKWSLSTLTGMITDGQRGDQFDVFFFLQYFHSSIKFEKLRFKKKKKNPHI